MPLKLQRIKGTKGHGWCKLQQRLCNAFKIATRVLGTVSTTLDRKKAAKLSSGRLQWAEYTVIGMQLP